MASLRAKWERSRSLRSRWEWLRGRLSSVPLFWVAFVVLQVAYLLPLLLNRYVPSQDAPATSAIVNIWRSLENGGIIQAEYDGRPGIQPYLVYFVSVRLFAMAVSIETAVRLVLVIYAIALPLSVWFVLRAFGKDERYSLLAFPFIYNTTFIYGFFSNLTAVPLVFFSLGLLKEQFERPHPVREVLFAVSMTALYFAHGLVALTFVVSAPVVYLIHVRSFRHALRRAVPALMPFAAALYSVLAGGYKKSKWIPAHGTLMEKSKDFLTWINDIFVSWSDELVLLVVVGTVLAALLLRPTHDAKVGKSWSLGLAAMVGLGAYFATPSHMIDPDHWATSARLVTPVFLLLLVGLPQARLDGVRGLVLVPAFLAMLWYSREIQINFAQFSAQAEDFDAVEAYVPEGQRFLPLVYDQSDGVHQGYPFRTFPILHQTRKDSYTPMGFAHYANMPIQLRKPRTPEPGYSTPQRFRYGEHGRYYDYFLAVFAKGARIPQAFPGADGKVELVASKGRFAAYRNTGLAAPEQRPVR